MLENTSKYFPFWEFDQVFIIYLTNSYAHGNPIFTIFLNVVIWLIDLCDYLFQASW